MHASSFALRAHKHKHKHKNRQAHEQVYNYCLFHVQNLRYLSRQPSITFSELYQMRLDVRRISEKQLSSHWAACIINEHVLQTFNVFTCTRNINHCHDARTNINVMFSNFQLNRVIINSATKQRTNFVIYVGLKYTDGGDGGRDGRFGLPNKLI